MRFLLTLLLTFLCGLATAQPATTNRPAVSFRTVDIYVDSQNYVGSQEPLAAYQLDFSVIGGNAKIVGIEGGAHPAFAEAPFYDPKAMQLERVILAAFSTNTALPTGKTRIATIHLQTAPNANLTFKLVLQTAADANGKLITATASAEERKSK